MLSRRSFLSSTGGLIAVGALAACGDGPPGASGADLESKGQPAAGPPNTITIKNFAFSPPSITVAPGAVVMVDNQDSAPHTVTANDKAFDSGNLDGKQRGSITAPMKAGEYPYICSIHQYMKGTLTVKAT